MWPLEGLGRTVVGVGLFFFRQNADALLIYTPGDVGRDGVGPALRRAENLLSMAVQGRSRMGRFPHRNFYRMRTFTCQCPGQDPKQVKHDFELCIARLQELS